MVKPKVLAFVLEFFERGILFKDLGVDFTLIPKKPGASALNDFRPISLLGSPYKILANNIGQPVEGGSSYCYFFSAKGFLGREADCRFGCRGT